MIDTSRPAEPELHAAAIRIARNCRHVIQGVLREEEWIDADREFYRVARAELEALQAGGKDSACLGSGQNHSSTQNGAQP
ncbi:hypothetical protein AB1L88_25820 [Tautonia sp. JC769]|uniref:hypothetical protein n=1 Tax=Tautonia sp. JC769 TaxID=3232135 RepID=UPI00345ABB01